MLQGTSSGMQADPIAQEMHQGLLGSLKPTNAI